MLGHRIDENCNLNRTALMVEKANRLGEQMTKVRDGSDNDGERAGKKTTKPVQNSSSIKAYFSEELGNKR